MLGDRLWRRSVGVIVDRSQVVDVSGDVLAAVMEFALSITWYEPLWRVEACRFYRLEE